MQKKSTGFQKIAGAILFVSLVLSIVYSLSHFLRAPEMAPEGDPGAKVKSDYLLMLTQCALGVVVMLLPSAVNRKWNVPIPRNIYIAYYIFLFCAIFLGEVFDFYYVIPHWDVILHLFSGAMLGALGFILVDLLNLNKTIHVSLSPLFESVFAFCFALALGTLWEIYEFSFDRLLGLNMQKAYTANGVALVGADALLDTMEDLIVDAIAALAVAIAGYKANKRRLRKQGDPQETEARRVPKGERP